MSERKILIYQLTRFLSFSLTLSVSVVSVGINVCFCGNVVVAVFGATEEIDDRLRLWCVVCHRFIVLFGFVLKMDAVIVADGYCHEKSQYRLSNLVSFFSFFLSWGYGVFRNDVITNSCLCRK